MKNLLLLFNELNIALSEDEKSLSKYNSGYADDVFYEIYWKSFDTHKRAAFAYAEKHPDDLRTIMIDEGLSEAEAVKRLFCVVRSCAAIDNIEKSLAYYGLDYLKNYWDIRYLPDDFSVSDFGDTLWNLLTFERILSYLDEYALELRS